MTMLERLRALVKIRTRVAAGTLTGADAIGVCVDKFINKYHVAKHLRPFPSIRPLRP